MDIHPPMGKLESLKEAAVHIVIVTIGILIALGLEGVRESWREDKAVAEARESFRAELQVDAKQLAQDRASLEKVDADLGRIVEEVPQLSRSPEELSKRVAALSPGFYFFRTTAWESALSSGALAHMKRSELDRFVDAYLGVKHYQEATQGVIPQWMAVETYFQSHHSLSPGELAAGEEKLRTLQMGVHILEHLGDEMSAGIKDALGTS